jgi:predicted RNA polymerase sigma factor
VTAEAVFRREYGRCVATLIRFPGDIDAAEEAVQDAPAGPEPAKLAGGTDRQMRLP